MLNAYAELTKSKTTKEDDAVLVKRAGTAQQIASTGTGVVRGIHFWALYDKFYVCIGRDVYVYDASSWALSTTLTNVVNAGTAEVGFEEFLYSTNTVKLIITDGTTLSTIDSANTVVPCADADMPVHQPYPVVIDGYLFVLKTGSADIYNSDNDDPLAWTAGNFITAEMRPDTAFRIASLNNYLICMGGSSIEYFYDAAEATGSPLGRNDSAAKYIGYIGGFSKLGGKIFFVGETEQSSPNVFMLEDFKATPLATEPVRRHLEAAGYVINYGAIVSFNGHDFYTLSTPLATYAMNLGTGLWSTWAYQDTSLFPIKFSIPKTSYLSAPYKNLFVTTLSNAVLYFDPSLGQDSATNFACVFTTGNSYFDSMNRKSCNRLTVYADMPVSSQVVYIQTSDDDYQTWSAGQLVELFQDMPCGYRWGTFRMRAHKITYVGSLPLRIEKLELDLNLGNS